MHHIMPSLSKAGPGAHKTKYCDSKFGCRRVSEEGASLYDSYLDLKIPHLTH